MKSKARPRNADAHTLPSDTDARNHGSSNGQQGRNEVTTGGDDISDLDEPELDASEDPDDERWDVFVLDDDDRDPLPELGDFWMPD